MAVLTEREREMMVTLDVSRGGKKKKILICGGNAWVYCGTQDHLCIHDVSIEPGYTVQQS